MSGRSEHRTKSTQIHIETHPPVATVRMDGPEHHNVLDVSGWAALAEAFHNLSGRDDLACVAVRGTGGRAFSAGSDIAAFETQRHRPPDVRDYSAAIGSAMEAVRTCPVPTVAIIEGICVGGGLEIAACCDLRVCAESSRFGAPISRLGLTMSHDELAPLLELLGRGLLLEILLTGELIHAKRALAVGLVSRVWPDAEVVEQGYGLVSLVASGAPLVNRWHKKFISRLLEGTPLTHQEREEAHQAFETADYREGRNAFLEKREPSFRGE